ncbi:DUF4245 family protein [Microbacterium sp. NIBRBAC000506063]|uniref:DUF4245 family protein n=1 Tax=Microbacterium sp. NIBRBAC000506063 TaxID=2734618 RepID=UPI001BB76D49|nr:DUF4245 family protein [Microbacterium sp. NIBRBAC000506063]QTV79878.1 DUF4245 family protein [Microbacterium sp. NIBRBAC000506063]
MNKHAPVVAELGRPETPEETAARKAASSKAYRSSQTFRNLIAALVVTIGALAVIMFAVPRGQITEPPPVDLAGIAAEASTAMDRPVLVPEVTAQWIVNRAELEGGPVAVWDVTLARPRRRIADSCASPRPSMRMPPGPRCACPAPPPREPSRSTDAPGTSTCCATPSSPPTSPMRWGPRRAPTTCSSTAPSPPRRPPPSPPPWNPRSTHSRRRHDRQGPHAHPGLAADARGQRPLRRR